jgi:hypothetical protein
MAIGVVLVVVGTPPPTSGLPLPKPDPAKPNPPPPEVRCSNFTGTYGVYGNGSGKGRAACSAESVFCSLYNGSTVGTLVPKPPDLHDWFVPEWKLTAKDIDSCKQIHFSNGTIWKLEK